MLIYLGHSLKKWATSMQMYLSCDFRNATVIIGASSHIHMKNIYYKIYLYISLFC